MGGYAYAWIEKTPPKRGLSVIRRLALQQRQNLLRNLVSFGQHGVTGLLNDLRFRHVGHFGRIVGVLDTGLRFRQVGGGVVQVGYGRAQTVLDRTQ